RRRHTRSKRDWSSDVCSSDLFLAARSAGRIPAAVRFQVSLPTPWAVVMPFVQQPDARQVYPAYERALLREVERILKAIPHHDLEIGRASCRERVENTVVRGRV